MPERSKEKPTVSVVIPTYNRAHLIGRVIDGVLDQTYEDFEIIVVDDGSSDNTEEVVRSLKDKRIRYIRHEKNKGAPAARNTGIRTANGEYIAFQDSDDEWVPEKLEKQMKFFENAPQEVGVVYTGFLRIVNGWGGYIPYPWVTKKEGDIHKELLKGSFITTPSIVVRKECFAKAGMFDERLPRLQDYELVLRLSKYYEFRFIDEPLLKSPYTADSLSSSEAARIRALKIILTKHLADFMEDEKSLSKYYFGIGIHLCLNNEIAEGESYITKAFEINPDRKLLSENYFIIGRRLCSNQNVKTGRDYLIKAINTYPLNIKVLIVAIISFFGEGFYKRVVDFYHKNERNMG
jgi:glycosyltransferase involved in cell wall biosynthesis